MLYTVHDGDDDDDFYNTAMTMPYDDDDNNDEKYTYFGTYSYFHKNFILLHLL